ncbi:G-D-S-L family lipolytic protein [Flaviramulus sp. BrNp1-15]|uniref:SGNH/GDSL hydrolase family protein n=1 Tax=Flaviramulus sp. BrNp1-15 TaxID=2916754 RepID=UPI001EE8C406|nr:SGNH/GDSL hydrolase family protein [Flaviramulus sp. BrNp1-15]ULC59906.1 G-D-S-L family lipolytic protein [Flaviramulus sp. BrNp1-15]
MKKNIIDIKYVALIAILIGFTSCNEIEDVLEDNNALVEVEVLPELNSGSADFSTYVSLGNSLTSGFTDNALFIAAQENSLPNILAQKFALAGGGDFSQPLMSDNVGGLLFGGAVNARFGPRLYFNGSGPAVLPAASSTETFANVGSHNNMGIPGAASFHLLYDGYGNPANLALPVPTANPYFVRMASAPDATVLGDAMAQSPTFFSLWIGNNDVLGYALSGGDATTSSITPSDGPPGVGFDQTYGALIATLTSGGAQGIVANIPYVTTIPHFTTVPHNPIPLDEATAGAVNQAYAAYNGGIQAALGALAGTGLFTQEEADLRMITFSAGEGNAVVIEDESLTDLGAINPAFAGLPKIRQATANDLLVLPSSNFIGTEAVPGNPLTVNGVAVPLADKWVLTPEEQEEIKTATDAFNATIQAAASSAGLAFVDANMLMQQLDAGGFTDGDYTLTSSLVTGGAFSLDGVHPTARGYALIANEFMKAIDAAYGSNFEASGNLVNIGNYPTNYSPSLQ